MQFSSSSRSRTQGDDSPVVIPRRGREETLDHVVMLDPEGNEFCVA